MLFARWCEHCLRSWPVVESGECERCGSEDTKMVDLITKATEIGQELKAERKAKRKEAE